MEQSSAILLSRQARGACGQSTWMRQTVAAVDFLSHRPCVLLSSTGMRTWNLITVLAGDRGMKLRLYVIVRDHEDLARQSERILQDYELSPELVTFEPIIARSSGGREQAMRTRDRLIIEQSRLLLPISVRPRGTMARWLDHLTSEQTLNTSFQATYEIDRQLGATDYSNLAANPDIDHATRDFLFHWTRTVDHPWPGESIASYCRALVTSDSYPRTARHTLIQIASFRLIHASPRHMPGNTPTVSFTSLPPSQTVPLMRWRARYGEMSFEPYAIGIRKSAAKRLGIRPVAYYNRSTPRPHDKPAWLTQSRGKITDWTAEQEWRSHGSISLGTVDRNDLLLICAFPHETAAIEKASGLRTLALFDS